MNFQHLALPGTIQSDSSELPRHSLIAIVDHYAGNARFLNKALALFALDRRVDITVDLEDGAAVNHETQRAHELALIVAAQNIRKVGVRIHPLNSSYWIDDLKIFFAKCGTDISHVTIPKVENVGSARAAIALIQDLSRAAGCITPFNNVHLIIESPLGVSNVDKLAALAGVRGLDFGIMDFVSCFGATLPRSAMNSPDQFTHPLIVTAKTKIILAASANGLSAAHNVTTQVAPREQAHALVLDDAHKARSLGFTRMWSIHPEQVPLIIEGFAASAAEKILAEAVLTKALANHWAPVEYEGVLYDRASYRWLWDLLSRNP